MEVQTIKEFAQANGFVQIAPSVRTNVNSYPFITFINASNVAENVYFSKNAAKMVGAGEAITKELLKQLQVASVINAAGEVRTKLVSNSERIDINSLLD